MVDTPQQGLFSSADSAQVPVPLAAAMRPTCLQEFVGQGHLLSADRPLAQAINRGHLHSFILWGPPGVGKTTLARIAAQQADARFLQLSAVMAGVRDIRDAMTQAQSEQARGRATVLFVDEVHRFNKAQQDAFLPYVEEGTITFIGATTENPSFELNSALLSRARVYRLRALEQDDLETLMRRALSAQLCDVVIDEVCLQQLAQSADGDGRRALAQLELAADLAHSDGNGRRRIDQAVIEEIGTGSVRRFDKGGDAFYDQISALHKSVRGSDPDASLYWFARMLDGGCDPLYIARRVVRMASEDVGNADPRALALALDAWQVQERLGSPEGELAIAQAITYLACAAKSNAVYLAYKSARAEAENGASHPVPAHLCNAPTALMKEQGLGQGYRYAHDEPDAYAAGVHYFPDAMERQHYYEPVPRGLEIKIREKLQQLRRRDIAATSGETS